VTPSSRVDHLARIGAALAVLVGVGLIAQRAASPEGLVLVQDQTAPWIMVDRPPTALLQQWGRLEAPVVGFETRFDSPGPGPRAVIRLRAFGSARVMLNGAPVRDPGPEGSSWKRFRELDATGLVRSGRNELRIDVANRRGPALLAVRLEGAGAPVVSGPHWVARLEDGAARGTRLASDARPYPDSFVSEKPLRVLSSRPYGPLVLFLFVLPWLMFLTARQRLEALSRWPGLPRAALALAALGWAVLFLGTFRRIDLATGFDAQPHLDYWLLLLQEGRIPLATEHWAAYQPPLFYLASGAIERLAALLGRPSPDAIALKLLPFFSGLGIVWLTSLLARRVLSGDRVVQAHATLFAAVLPVNLYTAAYYSNEGLHAFLAAAALVAGVGVLLADDVRPTRVAGISLLLGLAMLTKFTALLVALPLVVVLGAKILVRHPRPGPALLRIVALLGPILLVSGWFYARNVAEFGRPLVGNWDLPGAGRTWWSPPGFHTPQYYLRFGEVLVRPFYSGFVSFWDALYSTFWGDGFVAGRAGVRARHPFWNYDLMAAGYVLALPATGLLVFGFLRSAKAALTAPQAARRAAFGLLVATCAGLGFALFYLTLSLPYHGQARTNYVLSIVPALGLFFAWGFVGVDRALARRGWTVGRAALHGGWGALAAVLYLSFAA
jgi:hypothetical protein